MLKAKSTRDRLGIAQDSGMCRARMRVERLQQGKKGTRVRKEKCEEVEEVFFAVLRLLRWAAGIKAGASRVFGTRALLGSTSCSELAAQVVDHLQSQDGMDQLGKTQAFNASSGRTSCFSANSARAAFSVSPSL